MSVDRSFVVKEPDGEHSVLSKVLFVVCWPQRFFRLLSVGERREEVEEKKKNRTAK